MNLETGWTIAVVVGMFLALATTRVATHLIVLTALTALLVTGVVTPAGALAGLGNEGVVTVGALFVVAAAIQRTGVLNFVVKRLFGVPQGVRSAQARLVFPIAIVSMFMNNTPVVAMMLPLVRDWAKRVAIPASKLLIPLSYAAILGGLCSLVGSSTNMVVYGLWLEEGNPSMGLFELAKVGIPATASGLLVLLILGDGLLPDLDDSKRAYGDPREYLTELKVTKGGVADGATVREAGLRHLPGAFLIEVDRGCHVIQAVRPDEVLQGEDQLIFLAPLQGVVELQRLPGLEVATKQVFRLETPTSERAFVEAVISRTSPLIGLSVREAHFRNRYDAVVLGISRAGERVEGRVGEIRLRAGDGLLLETTPSFLERYAASRHFYLVSRVEGSGPATRDRAPTALIILGLMLLSASLGWLSMLQASMLAALSMIGLGVCSEETAFRAVDFRLLLAVAGALGLGHALTETGAAALLAKQILSFGGGTPLASLACIYLATLLLSELVTNNAAAAIMFPVAMATAKSSGVSPMPFAMTLMVAASASLISPFGYQTNLMVYGAGHYRFKDFVWIGVPVSLAVGATTLFLAPRIWPFYPL